MGNIFSDASDAIKNAWNKLITDIKLFIVGGTATADCVEQFTLGQVITFALRRFAVETLKVGAYAGTFALGTVGTLATFFGAWNVVADPSMFLSLKVLLEFLIGIPALLGTYKLYQYAKGPLPVLCPPIQSPRGFLVVAGIPDASAIPNLVFPTQVSVSHPEWTAQYGIDASGTQPVDVLYSNPNWVYRAPQIIGQNNFNWQYVQLIRFPFTAPPANFPDASATKVAHVQIPIITTLCDGGSPFGEPRLAYDLVYDPNQDTVYMQLEDESWSAVSQEGATAVGGYSVYSADDAKCVCTILYSISGASVWFTPDLSNIVGQLPNVFLPPMSVSIDIKWPRYIYDPQLLYQFPSSYHCTGLIGGDATTPDTTAYDFNLSGTLGPMALLTQARSDLPVLPVKVTLVGQDLGLLLQSSVVKGNYGPNGLPGQLQYIANAPFFPCANNNTFYPPQNWQPSTLALPCYPYGPSANVTSQTLMRFLSSVPLAVFSPVTIAQQVVKMDTFFLQPVALRDAYGGASVQPDSKHVALTFTDPYCAAAAQYPLTLFYSPVAMRYKSVEMRFMYTGETFVSGMANWKNSQYQAQCVLVFTHEDGSIWSSFMDSTTGALSLVAGEPQTDPNSVLVYLGGMKAGTVQVDAQPNSPTGTQFDWAFMLRSGWSQWPTPVVNPWPYQLCLDQNDPYQPFCLGPIQLPRYPLFSTGYVFAPAKDGKIPVDKITLNNQSNNQATDYLLNAYGMQLFLGNPVLSTPIPP